MTSQPKLSDTKTSGVTLPFRVGIPYHIYDAGSSTGTELEIMPMQIGESISESDEERRRIIIPVRTQKGNLILVLRLNGGVWETWIWRSDVEEIRQKIFRSKVVPAIVFVSGEGYKVFVTDGEGAQWEALLVHVPNGKDYGDADLMVRAESTPEASETRQARPSTMIPPPMPRNGMVATPTAPRTGREPRKPSHIAGFRRRI